MTWMTDNLHRHIPKKIFVKKVLYEEPRDASGDTSGPSVDPFMIQSLNRKGWGMSNFRTGSNVGSSWHSTEQRAADTQRRALNVPLEAWRIIPFAAIVANIILHTREVLFFTICSSVIIIHSVIIQCSLPYQHWNTQTCKYRSSRHG